MTSGASSMAFSCLLHYSKDKHSKTDLRRVQLIFLLLVTEVVEEPSL